MAIVASTTHSVGTRPASPARPGGESSGTEWQRCVQGAVRCPAELLRRVGLPDLATEIAAGAEAHRQFSTFAPEPWIARIRPGDAADPLLRQVLPEAAETIEVHGFHRDAVGDHDAARGPGLIHKYQGRALLVTSGLCAIHCRYCFRRHFPYLTTPPSLARFDEVLQTVRADPSIGELILSGGDPLMMSDGRLQQLVERIAAIPHVRRLRIHTRLPVVIPPRVTEGLVQVLRETRLAPWMVVHCNHPQEIDDQVANALSQLVAGGIPLLNQTVLLRGVNDAADVLVELSERLIDLRCMPYYLHQLDRVQGAAHFEVPVQQGRNLVREMRNRLPGYAVPRFVCEKSGEPAKRILA